ncbi:MAG TPA: MazG nucleotide pyrophosphohydrolase domain-containing protein [Anaerolineales bacterium]|nr:MazG nucleotide pyrophosphohydrolase domain-containing protein [Anaerolineales bacterium]
MEFQKLIDRAIAVRKQYSEKEQALYGSSWTSEEIALGFVGDVGDLVKLIVAENGKRNIPNSKEKLEHELSDCLWSIIVLAELHGISLEKAFMNTMDEVEKHMIEP